LWRELFGDGLTKAILLCKHAHATSFFEQTDFERYGRHHAAKAAVDEKYVQEFCATLHKKVDGMVALIRSFDGKPIGEKEFNEFMAVFRMYGPWHSGIKFLAEYLPPNLMDGYGEEIVVTRVYSEKTLVETEKFLERFATQVSEKNGVPPELVLCCLKPELEDYFRTGRLPPEGVLKSRHDGCALLFKPGRMQVEIGARAIEIESAVYGAAQSGVVTGKPAFEGKAVGMARIVLDPSKVTDFKQGDILVTGMTRPDFVPLLKKAGGVVTDGGGVLCHAAITAREFKIPAVIGTGNATKIFKDGDKIEVDGFTGSVKKID